MNHRTDSALWLAQARLRSDEGLRQTEEETGWLSIPRMVVPLAQHKLAQPQPEIPMANDREPEFHSETDEETFNDYARSAICKSFNR